MSNDLIEQLLPLVKTYMQACLIYRLADKEIKFASYMNGTEATEKHMRRFMQLMDIIKKTFSMRAFSKFKITDITAIEQDTNAFGKPLVKKALPKIFEWRRAILDEEFNSLNMVIPATLEEHAEVYSRLLDEHEIPDQDQLRVLTHIRIALDNLSVAEMCEDESDMQTTCFKFFCVSISTRLNDILENTTVREIEMPEEIVALLQAVKNFASEEPTGKRSNNNGFFDFMPKTPKNTVH